MVTRALASALFAAFELLAEATAPCEKALERWDFPEAVRLAQTLIRRNPSSAPAHVLLARAYLGQNQSALALAELTRASTLAPNNIDALYYLTKLSGILSQQQYLAVMQLAPDSARAHQLNAEGLAAHDQPTEAEREYLAALDKKPGAASILVALAELKRVQGDFESALTWYRKALDENPGFYDALYGVGACYYLLKDQENALDYFRRALVADPSSVAAKLALGQTLLAVKRPADALPLLEAAMKADPNLKRIYYLLARAYTAVGRKDDAAKSFKLFHSLADTESEEDLLGSENQP